MKGKLYLVPITLGESEISSVIPQDVMAIALQIRQFIVEDVRTVRRYLRKMDADFPIDDCQFYELNKHTSAEQLSSFLKPAEKGMDMAVISEAGVPGVADPGAEIVSMAHKMQIKVIPLVGPSSILMAVMASGLNGQNFAFNGYLPVKSPERIKVLKNLEKRSLIENQSQIFIETPYRNMPLLSDIMIHCNPETQLCIAADITLETEFIKTQPLKLWNNKFPDLNKRPAIFIIHG